MNRPGRIVLVLLIVGALFAGIAVTRGHIDGAAALAIVSIFFALAITAWAHTNRKRTR